MGASGEMIQARKDVAKGHLKSNWRKGMKQKDVRALLLAHAKSLAVPDMYDCVFKDDPDFLADLSLEVSEEMSETAHATGPIASLCEPLTAATLEENERSLRSARSSVSGDCQSRQDTKPTGNEEQPAEVPSYDDEDEADQAFNIIFLHPDQGKWKTMRARNCRERESFISMEAVSVNQLASCIRTIRGISTVELNCRPCLPGTGPDRTFATFFRVIEDDKLTNDVAVGSNAWKGVDTPPHSDSGFNESESAESIGSAGHENRAAHPHYDDDQPDLCSSIGLLTQHAVAVGALIAQQRNGIGSTAIGPPSIQMPPRPRSHRRKPG